MERYECQDVQAVLSGLLDGELDANTSHLAEAHLSQCAPCRTVLQKAEETDELLRATMGTYKVWPTDIDRRIRTAIFGEVDEAQTSQRRRRLLFAAWSGWSMAAVVMLGFGLSLSQGWFNPAPKSDGSLAGNGQPVVNIEPIATTWTPPVGSEFVPPSVFDVRPQIDQTQPVRLAATVDPPPTEMIAMGTPPLDPLVADVAPMVAFPSPAMSERALAAAESQVQAAQWLQLLASNLLATKAPEPGVVESEPAPQAIAMDVPRANDPDTGEVLHQASVLLSHLEQAGAGSFGDVRMVEQALSSDDVLERLASARGDMQSPDSVDLVNRAWSMLEWTTGSVDQDELERVKQSIAMQDLPRRLERLSDQYWN